MQPKFFLQENKYDYQKCEFGDSLWNYKCDSGQPIGLSGFCRKIQCGKVIADQCADEQEIACAYFFPAGKNADHKFLQCQ